MPDYSKGKIYKITGTDSNGKLLTYIGSTIHDYLCQRLAKHYSRYKAYKINKDKYISSFQILDLEDCIITLIQLYPCSCREELMMMERKYYDEYDCVNLVKPYVTKEEIRERTRQDNKKYKLKNPEQYKEHSDKRNVNILCEFCNCSVSKRNIARHLKTSCDAKKEIK